MRQRRHVEIRTLPRGRGECPPPPEEDAQERESWLRFPLPMDGRQSVERALRLLEACQADVNVAAGRSQRAMAQQILD